VNLPITTRYALRSLLRHKRRTFLSVLGIGVGCGICLFLVSFIKGEGDMMMRAAAESGVGHLRVAPEEWLHAQEMNLRLDNWGALLGMIGEMQHVRVATPHARTDALLAMGTRTAGVILTGVDPAAEPAINRLVRAVTEGEYLDAGRRGEVVLGKGIARRLGIGVSDDLMVTASGKGGEMRGAMLRVRGIVASGSQMLDNGLCQVLLADLEEISGYRGAAEISILLDNYERIDETASALRERLGEDAVVVTWQEIVPELAAGVEVDETWTNLVTAVVVSVVFLGIASAQLAAVLERRKEFAVLSAIGMKGHRLVRVMLAEGVILGGAGALASLLLATPFVYAISTHGIDFSNMYGDADMGISDILLDPVIYGDAGWWLLPLAFGLSLGATMLSSLYPAWYALSVTPSEALRVEQ